eukprot:gene3052-2034_t
MWWVIQAFRLSLVVDCVTVVCGTAVYWTQVYGGWVVSVAWFLLGLLRGFGRLVVLFAIDTVGLAYRSMSLVYQIWVRYRCLLLYCVVCYLQVMIVSDVAVHL